MKNIKSLLVFTILVAGVAGCGDKEKPTVTMPNMTGTPKLVGEGGKAGQVVDKVEAPPPGK